MQTHSQNMKGNELRILVWPGFSVVGLEIAEQLRFCKKVSISAASSSKSHPLSSLYKEVIYVENLNESEYFQINTDLSDFVIFPAHDYVLDYLRNNQESLTWIGSDAPTIGLTRDKKSMYKFMEKSSALREYSPKTFLPLEVQIEDLPVYSKPNLGYGSQGHQTHRDIAKLEEFMKTSPEQVITEVLEGDEYTVECFTSFDGTLVYAEGRLRKRIRMGTSLSFEAPSDLVKDSLTSIAKALNSEISFNGPWYFQVKAKNIECSDFKILEVSTRLPGSSVWARANGVNLAEMSVWNHLHYQVSALTNSITVHLERELTSKLSFPTDYQEIYIDLDETIIVKSMLNPWAVAFLIQQRNFGKRIHLISKSLEKDLKLYLNKHHIEFLFDTVHHLDILEKKSDYVQSTNGIFIDDSFSERLEVKNSLNIPCYGPDIFQLLVH